LTVNRSAGSAAPDAPASATNPIVAPTSHAVRRLIVSSYLGIAWLVRLFWLAEPSRQPACFQVFEAVGEQVAPAGFP
jgi:hypothetical protein